MGVELRKSRRYGHTETDVKLGHEARRGRRRGASLLAQRHEGTEARRIRRIRSPVRWHAAGRCGAPAPGVGPGVAGVPARPRAVTRSAGSPRRGGPRHWQPDTPGGRRFPARRLDTPGSVKSPARQPMDRAVENPARPAVRKGRREPAPRLRPPCLCVGSCSVPPCGQSLRAPRTPRRRGDPRGARGRGTGRCRPPPGIPAARSAGRSRRSRRPGPSTPAGTGP